MFGNAYTDVNDGHVKVDIFTHPDAGKGTDFHKDPYQSHVFHAGNDLSYHLVLCFCI